MSVRVLASIASRIASVSHERRSATRHRCICEASCLVVDSGPTGSAPAILEELSKEGLRLAVRRCYKPGLLLDISWRHPCDGPEQTARVRVVHTLHQGAGYWRVGCALVTPLTADQFASLL